MLKYIFMLDSQNVNFLVNIFRMCVSVLCYALYSLVSGLFQVIFYLANFDLLRLADDMADRIYIILGIFMLFKITLSLLNYLVSPDKISDKEVGASKLIMRVVLSLVMLVALPTGFEMLTEVQNQVLPVIPRVILGKDVGMTTGRTDLAEYTAESMTLPIVRAFASSATGCDTKFEARDAKDVLDNAIEKCPEDKSIYLIDYHGLISLIVAVLMVYVTFSLAISVAIRAFKLIILRVIAPAPIVSYIDPKSSKSDGMFSKWSKMLLSTWAELLINLAIIYFIIFMIMELFPNADGVSILANNGIPDGFIGGLVIAFLIIGLLMFAKDAPKFLMDALGLKSAGGFGRMLGMGATAIGAGGSMVGAGITSFKKNPTHVARNVLSTVGSGIGSLSAGGHALLTDKDGRSMAGVDAQHKYNANNLNNIKSGYGLGKQTSFFAKRVAGYDIDYEINAQDAIENSAKKARTFANTEGAKVFSDNNHFSAIAESGRSVNFSRNDWKAAVAQASVSGGPITIGGETFGAVGGSMEAKISGDLDDYVGNMFIEDYNRDPSLRTISNDKAEIYDGFLTSYANAAGVSKDAAKGMSSTNLKNAEKAASGKGFNLKQERGPNKK